MSERECCIDYRHVICIVACVQSPLPSGKIGEGALLRFFMRAGGSVHRLSALWKRNARPVTVLFALCSMLFTWCKLPCCTESRSALEQDMKQRKLLFLNDVSRLSVVLSQCAPSFHRGGFLPRELLQPGTKVVDTLV